MKTRNKISFFNLQIPIKRSEPEHSVVTTIILISQFTSSRIHKCEM